jgi:cytochrome c oxidase assembly factor CtaG
VVIKMELLATLLAPLMALATPVNVGLRDADEELLEGLVM